MVSNGTVNANGPEEVEHMFDCESELKTNYESASEASIELVSEVELDAADDRLYTPLDSDSEPALVSMAFTNEAESPLLYTDQASLSSHHSALPVSSLDHKSVQVQHAPREQSEALHNTFGSECKQEAAQQAPAVKLSEHSKRSRLSGLISSLRRSREGAGPGLSQQQSAHQLQQWQQQQQLDHQLGIESLKT